MKRTPIERTPEGARQGRTGLNVRWILFWGVALVIIAFAAVWLLR